MQLKVFEIRKGVVEFQYRKRYGLHAMRVRIWCSLSNKMFQYRKRYGLHAMEKMIMKDYKKSVSIPQAVWIACNKNYCFYHKLSSCFNTASGMDCMQCRRGHAKSLFWIGFNTASGMDCMQWCVKLRRGSWLAVSIPQAVWIACNITGIICSWRKQKVSIPQAVWIACNEDASASASPK